MSINFGYQKLMRIRQWLVDCQKEGKKVFINRFEKDNLERIRSYVLQPLK